MNELFNMFDKTPCKSLGVCSENPVLSATDAVIMNEIRQIAYYTIKLKELNFINEKIMKQAVSALTVSVVDTSFNKNEFVSFYLNLENIKKETEDFYIKKCKEKGISYENLTVLTFESDEKINATSLIKRGEKIIKHVLNTQPEDKIRLFDLIVLMVKAASKKIVELQNYKKVEEAEYFETLRLLALVNSFGARYEKLIRRIKEFSLFLYKLTEELAYEREKFFGEKEGAKISRNVYEGKSLFVVGPDLMELYNFLEQTKDEEINVYTNTSMFLAHIYPKFSVYKNLKGIFGIGDIEYDFSKFKGAIYVTEHSTSNLDNAFRGKIFTTKTIPSDNSIKIEKTNLKPLIDAIYEEEGFKKEKNYGEIVFKYDKSLLDKEIENAKDKKTLIVMGELTDYVKNNFKDYTLINLEYFFDKEALIYTLNALPNNEKAVYFSKCGIETIKIIAILLNKNVEIFIENCSFEKISPHIKEAFKKDFNIKFTC